MFGSHYVEAYSQTQKTVALSSAESDFYGIVEAAIMGLGAKVLMDSGGVRVEVHVNTDWSAAGMIEFRRGAGKVRHVDVRELWTQDKVAKIYTLPSSRLSEKISSARYRGGTSTGANWINALRAWGAYGEIADARYAPNLEANRCPRAAMVHR